MENNTIQLMMFILNYPNLKQKNGFIFLECLVSIAILTTITFMGIHLLINYLNFTRLTEAKWSAITGIRLAKEIFLKANESSNQYWGSVNMLISKNGKLTSSDNTPIEIPVISNQLQPTADSDILTIREVIPSLRFEVLQSKITASNKLELTLCGRIDQSDLEENTSKRDLQHWLGITVDGNYPLYGSLQEEKHHIANCNYFTYQATLSINADSAFKAICYFCKDSEIATKTLPLVILGIRSEFSLYVDRLKRFRRYSHIDKTSQPMLYNIAKFSIQPLTNNDYLLRIDALTNNNENLFQEMILFSKYDPRIGLEILL